MLCRRLGPRDGRVFPRTRILTTPGEPSGVGVTAIRHGGLIHGAYSNWSVDEVPTQILLVVEVHERGHEDVVGPELPHVSPAASTSINPGSGTIS